jgi:DNA-binding transcriptional LysR family regulator
MGYIPIMNGVHLGSLDLNLLLALDALLQERNVTRAAARLGITQSAASHALARLRGVTGDALLVRTKGGMVPTVRAETLGPPIRRALEDMTRALAPPARFDPRIARLRFTLGTSDYGELVLLPKLVELLAREAPHIDLRVHTIGTDVSAPLGTAAIDLAIAPVGRVDDSPGLVRRRLFDERFVCVVRRGHPLAGKRKLTLARFAAASHALISPSEKEGGFVDDALARMGMARRVAVMVPHFLMAPHLVASSDLVLTLARRVADVLAKPLRLALLEPPKELSLAGFTMSAMWHERTQNDPAQRWLREQLVELARRV